jgi:alkylated DNA repair dioxygenase AlkB
MDLFSNLHTNLLPCDGTVNYFEQVLNIDESKYYFEKLNNTIAWKNDEVVMFGKRIVTKRKTAWYATNNYAYTYSNVTKIALPFTKELIELKTIAEKLAETTFNSCLLNLYHNGNEGMAWHSDNEVELGENNIIASISLGAARPFLFKHKNSLQKIGVTLNNGSILVMKGATQGNWLHSLPKTTKVQTPRINLTFRTILT